MKATTFCSVCGEFLIDPLLAQENENIIKVLKADKDEKDEKKRKKFWPTQQQAKDFHDHAWTPQPS